MLKRWIAQRYPPDKSLSSEQVLKKTTCVIYLIEICPDFSCFLSCTVRANVPRTRYVCNKWRILHGRAEIRNFSSSVEIFVKISSFRAKAHLVFSFYFSSYPDQRVKKDPDDLEMGVIGSVSLLQNANLSTQPITSFDWSPDKVSRADPEHLLHCSYLNGSYLFYREFC